MASGRLWNQFVDDHDVNDNAPDSKSFEYKTKTAGETAERRP